MDFFTKIDGRTYEIQVNRKRMKRVRLKIFPTMEIKLSVPYDTPDEWIVDFLIKKQSWLEERASIFKSTRAIEKEEHITSGTATRVLGRQITIQVIKSDKNRIEKDDQRLFIYTVALDQAMIDDQFDKWWQKQAKAYFQTVLDRQFPIIKNHGISKPAIFVRKMKLSGGLRS
jgi:predicted metal-dependent hydrolase